jgi:small subunit ribosomal protein S6
MATERTGYYEAMFLVSQAVAADLQGLLDHLREIFRRANAEVVAIKKWDERRLAYEIDKQKRGVYILAYITAPTSAVDHINRDVNLSERIMRCLIVRADHLTVEEMQAADARQALADEARLRAEPATVGADGAEDEVPELDDVE